ncbi:MAG TPA: carbon monoxide dehydrogenase subunit G [Burkholderiales bacterium]|nr:carbon monoxide dehydrogenase subunit G [Burkholderiales bacterium]
MEMKGEQLIAADRPRTWAALNDPETLKACIPGCESITPTGENQYEVLMTARVGPVSAKFKGKLALTDVNPPESYSIAFEGQGGTAGFGKGGAKVRLSEEGPNTRLAYDVTAQVGGKLAQIGSRLVDAAAKKIASDFFERFNEKVASAAAEAPAAELQPASPGSSMTKVVAAAIALVLAIALLAWLAR